MAAIYPTSGVPIPGHQQRNPKPVRALPPIFFFFKDVINRSMRFPGHIAGHIAGHFARHILRQVKTRIPRTATTRRAKRVKRKIWPPPKMTWRYIFLENKNSGHHREEAVDFNVGLSLWSKFAAIYSES